MSNTATTTETTYLALGIVETLEQIESAISVLDFYGVELLEYVVEEDIMHLNDEARTEVLDALEVLRRYAPDAEHVSDVWHAFLNNTLAVEFVGKNTEGKWTVTGAEVTITYGGPSVWLEIDLNRASITACASWGSESYRYPMVAAPTLIEVITQYADTIEG